MGSFWGTRAILLSVGFAGSGLVSGMDSTFEAGGIGLAGLLILAVC